MDEDKLADYWPDSIKQGAKTLRRSKSAKSISKITGKAIQPVTAPLTRSNKPSIEEYPKAPRKIDSFFLTTESHFKKLQRSALESSSNPLYPLYQTEKEFHVSKCRQETPFFRHKVDEFDATQVSPQIINAMQLYNQRHFQVVRFAPDSPLSQGKDSDESEEEPEGTGEPETPTPTTKLLKRMEGRKIASMKDIFDQSAPSDTDSDADKKLTGSQYASENEETSRPSITRVTSSERDRSDRSLARVTSGERERSKDSKDQSKEQRKSQEINLQIIEEGKGDAPGHLWTNPAAPAPEERRKRRQSAAISKPRIRQDSPEHSTPRVRTPDLVSSHSTPRSRDSAKIDPNWVGQCTDEKRQVCNEQREQQYSESILASLLEKRYEVAPQKIPETPVKQFWPTNPNQLRFHFSIDDFFVEGKPRSYVAHIGIYDRQTKTRRSEDFTFLTNSTLFDRTKSPETTMRQCVFTVTPDSSELLVILVKITAIGQDERLGTAELDKDLQGMSREKISRQASGGRGIYAGIAKNPKATSKLLAAGTTIKEEAVEFPDKSPVLWGGCLFPYKITTKEKRKIDLLPPKKGFDDTSLLENIDEALKKELKRAKNTPGSEGSHFWFTLRPVGPKEALGGVLDQSNRPLKPFSSNYLKFDDGYSKIQQFSLEDPVFFHFINNLYIYPTKFNNLKAKGQLQVAVQFKDNDKDLLDPGLEQFYGHAGDEKLISICKTCLAPSDAHKPFFDEIKLWLPIVLTPKHHLLFTIYNIEKEKSEKKIKSGKHVIGHCVYLLMKGDKLSVTPRDLPITSLPSTDYLQCKEIETDPDKHGKTLSVAMRLISSIHHRLGNLSPVSSSLGAKYFPLVLRDNVKFMCLQTNPKPECKKRMQKFLEIVEMYAQVKLWFGSSYHRKLNKENEQPFLLPLVLKANLKTRRIASHSSLIEFRVSTSNQDSLSTFVPYLISAPLHEGSALLHESLVKWFLVVLKEDKSILKTFHYSAFMVDLITRAMCTYLEAPDKASLPHKKRFPSEFIDDLVEVCATVIDSESSYSAMGPCLIQLLAVIDRGIVLYLISLYLSVERTPNQGMDRINFFKALVRYPSYVALNCPTVWSNPPVSLSEYLETHKQSQFLANSLINEITYWHGRVTDDDSKESEKQLRGQLICAFRRIIGDHWEAYELKQLGFVLSIYFPFLPYMVSSTSSPWWELLRRDQSISLRQEYLACFLFLLRFMPEGMISWWAKGMSISDHQSFFKILKACDSSFGKDGQPNKDVSLCITYYVNLCVELFRTEQINPNAEIAHGLFNEMYFLILPLFKFDNAQFRLQLCYIIHQLLDIGERFIFQATGSEVDYLTNLIYELMNISNQGDAQLRSIACSLLYRVFRSTYLTSKIMTPLTTRANIAVSKILGAAEKSRGYLSHSINNLKEYSQTDQSMPPEWPEQVSQLTTHLNNLTKQIATLSETGKNSDPEMLASLYHEISLGFSNSPALRVTWLDILKKHHIEEGNHLEAGQVDMHVAAIMIGYLKKSDLLPFISSYVNEMVRCIAPNAIISQTDEFTDAGWQLPDLETRLESASHQFEKATFFELALESQTLLGSVLRTSRNANFFDQLTANLKSQIEAVKQLSSDPGRLEPVYFRIGFYGSRWESRVRGKQFIYKKHTQFSLPLMKKSLENTFGTKYGSDLEILLTNSAIDVETLDRSKYYIQLAGVVPYVGPKKARSHTTIYDQNFNFLFESAVHSEDEALQSKKKTIFTTEHPFPYVENRILVTHVQEILLLPIQNAIELINKQTGKVSKFLLLTAGAININALQQTLQGSVLPMVNPGPYKICEIFLNPETILASPMDLEYEANVITLIDALRDFLKNCSFAILLNLRLCEMSGDSKHNAFNKMLYDKGFMPTKETITGACKAAEVALATRKRLRQEMLQEKAT